MNIRQIQSFIAVADTKSFSEAAQLMYTSVSQISKLVKGFEEELGQVFFVRKKNGAVLTPEGMKIYNVANKILKDIDDIEFLKERRGKESFTVLGLPDVFLDDIFIRYMNSISDSKYFYNLSYKTIDNVSQELHVRKADIAFAYIDKIRYTAIQMRLKDYALSFTPLGCAKKYVFVNRKHPFANKDRIDSAQIEKAHQIKINGTDFFNSEIKKSSELDICAKPDIKMITHNLSTAINVVAETDMVYMGCDISDRLGKQEGILRIPFENGESEANFGYIKRSNIELSETARSFVSFVSEEIEKITG